jgi:DNA anti-recombination protein RmuC
MATIVLDTAEFEEAGFTQTQAGALARILTSLVAKIQERPKTLEGKVANVREEVARQDGALKLSLAEHKAATQDKMEALREEVHGLRVDLGALRGDMVQRLADIETRSERRFTDVERTIQTSYRMLLMWMVTVQIAGLALMAGIVLGLR